MCGTASCARPTAPSLHLTLRGPPARSPRASTWGARSRDTTWTQVGGITASCGASKTAPHSAPNMTELLRQATTRARPKVVLPKNVRKLLQRRQGGALRSWTDEATVSVLKND